LAFHRSRMSARCQALQALRPARRCGDRAHPVAERNGAAGRRATHGLVPEQPFVFSGRTGRPGRGSCRALRSASAKRAHWRASAAVWNSASDALPAAAGGGGMRRSAAFHVGSRHASMADERPWARGVVVPLPAGCAGAAERVEHQIIGARLGPKSTRAASASRPSGGGSDAASVLSPHPSRALEIASSPGTQAH